MNLQLRIMRRKFVLYFVVAAAVVALFTLYQSNQIKIRYVRIESAPFAQRLGGKKVVLLSDPHFTARSGRQARTILKKVRALAPDMILLTGDFVQWFSDSLAYAFADDFLRRLNAPFGVYAVLGDADYTLARLSCRFCHLENGRKPAPRDRITFLRNNAVDVALPGGVLRIAGLDGRWPGAFRHAKLDSLLAVTPVILLSHFSAVYDALPADADVLVLSGDTHGGQFILPDVLWRLTRRKPDPRHLYGFFRETKKMLYVTAGLGTSSLHLRLGVRPEIVIFRFE